MAQHSSTNHGGYELSEDYVLEKAVNLKNLNFRYDDDMHWTILISIDQDIWSFFHQEWQFQFFLIGI